MTGSDPQRRAPVNSTYAQTFSACAYALKCLIDPDLPVNDGFYRLRLGGRAGGHGHELHVARAGGRRLGDADAARRRALQGAPARAARAAAGGDEGDDVPGGLRLRSTSTTGDYTCFYETFAGGYGGAARERRPGRGAGARPEHRERAGRGDRAQLPGADRRATRSSRTPRARAGSAAGSGCAATTASTGTTTFTILADRDRAGPVGRVRRRSRPRRPSTSTSATASRRGSASKTTLELVAGRRRSASGPAAAAATARPRSATRSACCATCCEGKVSAERAPRRVRRGDRPTGAVDARRRPTELRCGA